jgi:hypothetical protein
MPIYAKSSGGTSFIPAPAGSHAAVCVDVVDLGVLKVTWGGKDKSQHKINIVWQIDEDRDDGKPHQVRKRYTLSLHEKASLRKDLESWRGQAFTDEELQGFDVERLIGVPCLLSVIHAKGNDGGTFANVASIMRLPKGMTAPAARDYVRVCDREPSDQAEHQPYGEITDDDVPF